MKCRLYPAPNKGFVDALTSPQAAIFMYNVALKVKMAYSVNAPKRSGHLATSARASLVKRSPPRARFKGDRWVGRVTVGAEYGVWNETGAGIGMHLRSSKTRQPRFGPFKGSYTFRKITEPKGI